MAFQYGRDSFFGIGKESTHGTKVSRTKFLALVSESGGYQVAREMVRTFRDPVPVAAVDGPARVVKQVGFLCTYEGMELLLKHLFWKSNTPSGSAPYTHNFTREQGSSPPAGATCEIGTSEANGRVHPGGRIKKGEFKLQVGQAAMLDVEYSAQDELIEAKSSSPSFPDLSSLLVKPTEITAEFDSGAVKLNQVNIAVDSGSDDGEEALGESNILEQGIGDASVTGSFERRYNGSGAYDKLKSGAHAELVVTCQQSASLKWVFTLGEIYILGDGPNHDGPGASRETINFEAQYDASTTALQLAITNSLSEAAAGLD